MRFLLLFVSILLPLSALAQFERYGWAEAFALSGGGVGGLKATAAPNQTVILVPGPTQFINDADNATGKAPFMTWDGTGWKVAPFSAAGCGSFSPNDVTVFGSELYVGGNIPNLCNTGAVHLGRYDPLARSWVAVTAAPNAQVSAIEWDGNDRLYVGGSFDRLGASDVDYIFYLQQGTVNSLFDQGNLVSGTNLPVRDIALGGGGVLVVGDFTTAGGRTGGTCCVASWNPGTTTWSMFPEIASGLSVAAIRQVLGFGGDIYLGGDWTFPALPAEDQPSRAAVGGSGGFAFLGNDPRGAVVGIASSGGGVFFAANMFDQDLGDGSPNSGPNLAEWAGVWLPLDDNGLLLPSDVDIVADGNVFITQNNQTRLSATANDTLIAGGSALFNPSTRQFEALGQGVGFVDIGTGVTAGTVRDMALFEGQLVIGGRLNFGGIRLLCCGLLARDPADDNAHWTTLGLLEGDVHTLEVFDNALWVGGALTSADASAASSIARYANGAWDVPDTGLPGGIVIRDLHTFNGALYAGAATSFGGALVNGNFLFRWTGSQWERVLDANSVGYIVALATFQGALHAAGAVPTGAFSADDVGRLSAGQFEQLAGGIPGSNSASALFAHGSNLIVGGRFTSVDNGLPARHIAAWDGTAWSALGSGLGGDSFSQVMAVSSFNGRLIAAGDFGERGDGTLRTISRIAFFDGADWQPLAGGVVDFANFSGSAHGLLPNGQFLWVGGEFDQAGGRESPLSLSLNIARLEDLDFVFGSGFEN